MDEHHWSITDCINVSLVRIPRRNANLPVTIVASVGASNDDWSHWYGAHDCCAVMSEFGYGVLVGVFIGQVALIVGYALGKWKRGENI